MILINSGSNRAQKLGGFSRYVPIGVPIGVGYLAAYLIKHNKTVKILDGEVNDVTEDVIADYLKGLIRPYIFGISSLTAGIANAHRVAALLKKTYPESKVILGNMHPTVMTEEVLKDRNVDIVVRGEGEEVLNSLYERIKADKDYSDIKSISFYKNGKIVHNEIAPLPDLATVPRFPYHLFDEHSNKYNLGFITSSRGCPYNCIFCSQRNISGKKYRYFPPETVIQDLDELILKYKRTFITFVDDSFLTNKERVMQLCQCIREKDFHKKAIFDCQARGDTVDEEVLKELKGTGFRTIHFGIETASERLMKLIDKRETVQEIVDGIRLAKKIGFQVSGTFILGLPTETREEREAAYKLAKELSLDYVRFNNATPYPGTRLYDIANTENRLNPGAEWANLNACGTLVESPFKSSSLAYVPCTTTARELSHDILKFNLFYSFRLKSIFKILKERIGPAGWLALPEKWYLKPGEWSYLTKFAIRVSFSFAKVFFYDATRFLRRR